MALISNKTGLLVIALIVLFGAAAPAMYWAIWGRAASITVDQAMVMLSDPAAGTLLVDVRPAREYRFSHLDGAVSWPYEQITRDQVPQRYAGKRLLLVCEGGQLGAAAAAKMRTFSRSDVFAVRGGMQAWIAAADKFSGASYFAFREGSGTTSNLPFRNASDLEEWAAALSAFAVKPLYMTGAVVLAFLLRRQRSADLAALRWGLTFFFVGEAFCAVNYLLFGETSYLAEHLHSFGMVLSFTFATYALFEGIDLRLIHYSDPGGRCAALGLCRACIKQTDAPCGLKRLFLVTIPILIALGAMPLCAQLQAVTYNTRIFDSPYTYTHPVIHQIFEIRFCPLAAMILLVAALIVLLLRKNDAVHLAKVLFAGGMGYLGFSFLRMIFLAAYRDNLVWFAFWEEITELAFVLAAGAMLWIFRQGLFAAKPTV